MTTNSYLDMKIIHNDWIPFQGFRAINIFGIVFVRGKWALSEDILMHEYIHTLQMRETLYIFFYIWYVFEWFIKLFKFGGKSYEHISFEREAYKYMYDPKYPEKRKKYTWFKLI